jgi:hypothetical protein
MSTAFETLQNGFAEAIEKFTSYRKQHNLYYSRSRTPAETAVASERHKDINEIREEITNVATEYIERTKKYYLNAEEASETHVTNSESAKVEALYLQMKMSSLSARNAAAAAELLRFRKAMQNDATSRVVHQVVQGENDGPSLEKTARFALQATLLLKRDIRQAIRNALAFSPDTAAVADNTTSVEKAQTGAKDACDKAQDAAKRDRVQGSSVLPLDTWNELKAQIVIEIEKCRKPKREVKDAEVSVSDREELVKLSKLCDNLDDAMEGWMALLDLFTERS